MCWGRQSLEILPQSAFSCKSEPGFLWEEGVVFKCTLFNYFSGVSINCKTQNRLIRIRPHRGVYNSDFRDVTNE